MVANDNISMSVAAGELAVLLGPRSGEIDAYQVNLRIIAL
jgi:hypothetical protein